MKNKKIIIIAVVLIIFIGGVIFMVANSEKTAPESGVLSPDYPAVMEQWIDLKEGDTLVVFHTNMGDITFKMLPDIAPKAVENFTTHVADGYYDGLIFHRIIKDFMIQGGDPKGTGTGGESIWGSPFEDEFSSSALNYYGALSMANSGPNTNGSQFFIVQASSVSQGYLDAMTNANYPQEIVDTYEKMGGTPHLDGVHTVFGYVIDGMDVVEDMAAVKMGTGDKPVNDIIITSAEVKSYSK